MASRWQRAFGFALGGMVPVSALAACAPERDVVATELAPAGASAPLAPCQRLLDGAEPALTFFDFENSQDQTEIPDATRAHSVSVVGTRANLLAGPEGCGKAFGFGSDERWLLLGDDPAWTLDQGSIDAWFWVPDAVTDVMGIISRDQFGDQVGHFSVFLLRDRTVMARLQQSEIGALPTLLTLGCSSRPLPAASWAHFGFNFGPGGAALYVNGVLAARTGTPGFEIGPVACGATAPNPAMPDLPLPWVIGASIYASKDAPNVRQFPFLHGAIDNLRISAQERDFAASF